MKKCEAVYDQESKERKATLLNCFQRKIQKSTGMTEKKCGIKIACPSA